MKKSGIIKTVLVGLTVLLLFVWMVQERYALFTFKPLQGVFQPTPAPSLSFDSYRTMQYQDQMESYLSEHLGFREPLFRLYNQFLYDFFRKTYSEEVVIGKDYWSYFRQHVNEYYGTEMYRWYDSKEEACADFDREARLMWKLRGVLQDYGIEFLMFMAPDKGFLYPEHLPYRKHDTTTVNAREYYSAKFDEYGFPYIEMTKWFLEIKEADTLPYSLMPQAGAHWGFSAVLGADSLFRFMGSLNNQRLPELRIGPLHESSRLIQSGDRDLENTLNLMRILPHRYDKLLDAEVTVVRDSATIWPNVLFVGNSFLWRMHDFIPFDDMFCSSEYWFYNSTANYGKNYSKAVSVLDLDILQKILDNDYVVWFTDGNQMYKVSYGFVEMAIMQLCLSDERREAVKRQVVDSLVSDSATRLKYKDFEGDALMAKLWERTNELLIKNPEKYFPEIAGDSIPTARNPRVPEAVAIRTIKRDAEWMKKLQCQMVFQNATLDEVLKMEAQNMLNGRPLIRDLEIEYSSEVYKESLVKSMMEDMRHKPSLMEMVKEKAAANGMTIEEQLEADARWIVNDQINRGEILMDNDE